MSNHQTEVEADLAAAQRLGATRVAVTTEKAIAALALVEKSALLRADHVIAHAKSFQELAAKDLVEVAKTGRAALTAHTRALDAEEHAFWEAFHGQVVRGIELVKWRAPSEGAAPSKATQEVKP